MKTLTQTLIDLQDLVTNKIITEKQYDEFATIAAEKMGG